eukprot:1156032-Pelagomonas_calceolata.AAC.3
MPPAYQCHLCVKKDWLRQFYSVACDASLTCLDLKLVRTEKKDYASQVYLRALRNGTLTSKLAGASPKRLTGPAKTKSRQDTRESLAGCQPCACRIGLLPCTALPPVAPLYQKDPASNMCAWCL